MKQVLLLTDFSENSINAIRYSVQLLNGQDCSFFVLHVKSSTSYMTDDVMSAGNESIYDSLVKDAKEKLDEFVKELTQEFKSKSIKFDSIIDFDDLTAAINQVIQSKKIDLIAMGSNGITGAKEVILGSNTLNVIRNIDCTTLIVPEGFEYKIPEHILVPLDAADSIIGTAFDKIKTFAQKHSSKLHVLRINENDTASLKESDLKQLDNLMEKIPYQYHLIKKVPMQQAISSYIQTHTIDLMALIHQKEHWLDRIISGSSIKAIGNNLQVPLMLLHTNNSDGNS